MKLQHWTAAMVVVAAVAPGPYNDLPNPYDTVSDYFKLPDGRSWGSTSTVDIDKDGVSIWAAERCGANSCAGSKVDPVFKFNKDGTIATHFGGGLFNFPHGIHVDAAGNVWITDGQGPDGKDRNRDGKGHTVVKFDPTGKVLMRMGRAGVAGRPPDALTEPNDVITAPNGDIFVAEGHSGQNAGATPDTVARISKFRRDGTFVKSWGKLGTGPGEFRTPHALAFDSKGRLFVADRGNVRIQVFDQDGGFLGETKAFSRLSGIAIKDDILYAADSESAATSNPGWRPGIRIGPISGPVADMKPVSFIPDPAKQADGPGGTSAAEGVAVDAAGNVYGAEVGPKALKKYVKKRM
ncbi:MAG TPA: peptidyl-alpha-hydroxyglycine alpha-amidating lyase family protein [Vicinamibacterales bacterium]|nr:peptidyl-alpha-hydroxyglycine alpha-amidating lyase family protein [Vicinamibacterales bacterium]